MPKKTDNFEDDIFNIERQAVPDSSELQSRILAETACLPQRNTLTSQQTENGLLKFPWRPVTLLAIAASLVLAVVLWLPMSVDDSVEAVSLTIEELEFQEALLMQDELSFAQL